MLTLTYLIRNHHELMLTLTYLISDHHEVMMRYCVAFDTQPDYDFVPGNQNHVTNKIQALMINLYYDYLFITSVCDRLIM